MIEYLKVHLTRFLSSGIEKVLGGSLDLGSGEVGWSELSVRVLYLYLECV